MLLPDAMAGKPIWLQTLQPGSGAPWQQASDWLTFWEARHSANWVDRWTGGVIQAPWSSSSTGGQGGGGGSSGGGGNQGLLITGTDLDDTLVGGPGQDTLIGLAGDDLLYGNEEADTLDGGAGVDTASYETATSSVDAQLSIGGQLGDASGDTYIGIENLTGSNFDDVLVGDAGVNTLSGLDGDDQLRGEAGDDTLIGGAGADAMDGGAGIDTASYESAGSGVDVRLYDGTGLLGEALGDTFTDIENLTGSAFADLLVGNSLDNVLSGGDGDDTLVGVGGNDTIEGGAGNDTLNGGDGDDQFIGGAGADQYFGGAGIDTLSFEGASAGVDARLDLGSGFRGDALGDTYSGIENLVGTSFSDGLFGNDADNLIIGDAGADALGGGGGNDTLIAGAGNDSLDGGAGNDTLIGGAGADNLVGGTGIDTVSYADATSGVDARLSALQGFSGDALGDTYAFVENLMGSDFDDLLLGNFVANELTGGDGNDVLFGDDGNDFLIGGIGDDLLSGGSGNDTFVFRTGHGADEINDFTAGAGTEDIIFFDNGSNGPNSFADVLSAASQVGADTVIDLGGGDSITLLGVNLGMLDADDFMF